MFRFILLTCLLSSPVFGSDLNWSGQYRFEVFSLVKPDLQDGDKSYILHHLALKPNIIAADGLKIQGRFDLFNNKDHSLGFGDFLGGSTSSSPVLSANSFQVTSLYLQWVNEYGVLLLGRAPFNFGLGMSYNNGEGEFAHGLDVLDMVGYKVVMGHMSITPFIVKGPRWSTQSYYETPRGEQVDGNPYGASDPLNLYGNLGFMLHVQYDNPNTDLNVGLLYTNKSSVDRGRGLIPGEERRPGRGKQIGGNQFNLFVEKHTGQFEVGVEAAFLNGNMEEGQPGNVRPVELGGFGIAGEIGWKPGGRFEFFTDLGYATGDDLGTPGKYEGFLFDKNYDVGMLLFNHFLGRFDVLQTGNDPRAALNLADVEWVTNTIYVKPGLRWKVSGDKWVAKTSVLYAVLEKSNDNFGKNLGIEWDASMTYRPHEHLTWVSGVGLFFPGSAFERDQAGSKMAFGLETKLAVQF